MEVERVEGKQVTGNKCKSTTGLRNYKCFYLSIASYMTGSVIITLLVFSHLKSFVGGAGILIN